MNKTLYCMVLLMALGCSAHVWAGAREDALLADAVRTNDPQKVLQAIQAGANVNAKADYSKNLQADDAQEKAATKRGEPWASTMLKERKNWEYWAELDGLSPLLLAAKNGNFEIAKLLVAQHADVKAVDAQGQTAIMFAAAHGNLDFVKWLIAQGADLHGKEIGKADAVIGNALTEAIGSGNLELVRYLVQKGLDPNDPALCKDALRVPIDAKGTALRRYLLDIPINGECLGGSFVEAARQKNRAVMTELLSKGAPISYVVYERPACTARSALSWAAKANDKEMVEWLITRGANPNAPDDVMCGSPLDMALGNNDLVAYLLRQGADPRGRMPFVRTPEMGDLFLANGATIDETYKNCYTLLNQAAWSGDKKMVSYAISKGADVNLDPCADDEVSWRKQGVQMDSFSPLARAKAGHHDDIVALLKKAGAKE